MSRCSRLTPGAAPCWSTRCWCSARSKRKGRGSSAPPPRRRATPVSRRRPGCWPPRPGNTADQIAEAADAAKVELLVVGSHGRRGVQRLLLGSVAERLVRKANVSVLIVRGEAS
ncbi:MAG: universal stress protein [Comamonadaceae bacterium]|nr:universal stress protein [Comamonadaceae bacterium]